MINYDAHNWRDHLFDIRGSMIRQILYRILPVVAWSAAVVLIHSRFHRVEVNEKPHALVGVALGLLLVFRTNASYDRFWEGRKLWGGIVNETRNLARSASTFIPDKVLVASLIRWTIAFPWATMNSLRGSKGLGPIAEKLEPGELQRALAADHVPLYVTRQISAHLARAIREKTITDIVAVQIDNDVQQLVDYMGACERIHKTPLPFAYVVHLRRALLFYYWTLPFALVGSFGWWTLPAVFLLGYVLFGIEEIGVEIEDPFGVDDNDLPLEAICMTITRNLSAIANEIDPATADVMPEQREAVPASAAAAG